MESINTCSFVSILLQINSALHTPPNQRSHLQTDSICSALSRITLFNEFSNKLIRKLTEYANIIQVKSSQTLYESGSTESALYYIINGSVHAYAQDAQNPKPIDDVTVPYITGHICIAKLTANNWFGITSIASVYQHIDTAVASAGTLLLTITRANISTCIRESNEQEYSKLASFLKSLTYFTTWANNKKYNFLKECTIRKYLKREVVIEEHRPSYFVYIIRKGEFTLSSKLVKGEKIRSHSTNGSYNHKRDKSGELLNVCCLLATHPHKGRAYR